MPGGQLPTLSLQQKATQRQTHRLKQVSVYTGAPGCAGPKSDLENLNHLEAN